MNAKLQVVTGFGTGIAVATLALLAGDCRRIERVDNNDQFTGVIQWPAPVSIRSVIRLTGSDGRVTEYRVTNVQPSEDKKEARIDAAGPWLSIARAGLIRDVSNGMMVYSFGGQYTLSEALNTYFLPNCDVDGLDWIDPTLGTIETDALVQLTWERWDRMQLLQDIVRQTGCEPYLVQSAPGARWQLACADRRGGDAEAYTVASRTNLLQGNTDQSDVEILTGVTPLGDVVDGDEEPSGIGENAWTVGVIDSNWLNLYDPAGLVEPIAFDGEYNDLWLEFATTTTPVYRQIRATRKSDQAIKLDDTTTLNTTGLQVRICADASGTPLHRLVNPGGVFAYGQVLAQEAISGARGERNWLRNGGFLAGGANWTPGASGFVSALPISENVDLVMLKNGSTASGNTSFAVDGGPPGATIRRGEMFRSEGLQITSAPSGAGHTIKSDGKATITGAAPLTASLTDGQVLGYSDANGILTATVDGAHSASATTLLLKSFASGTRQLTNGDKIQFEYGGTYRAQSDRYQSYKNFDASPVVISDVIHLWPDEFTDTNLNPATPLLVVGDSVTLTQLSGESWSAVLWADYVPGSGFLSLDITIPVGGTVLVTPTNPFFITAVKSNTVLKTLTNASVEFSEAGTATATWSGGLAQSYSTANARWMDSASVLLDYLTITSGAGNGATSAVLTYPNRKRIFPLAVFDNGNIGTDLLFVAADVTLNGSGAGTITSTVANTATLNDNAFVRVFRNSWGWPSAAGLVNVLRIVNGATSTTVPVLLRGTAPRVAVCTVEASIYVPIGTNIFSSKGAPNTNLCPVVLDINDGVTTHTQTVQVPIPPSWATTDPRPVPVTFTITQSFNLTASRMVWVKVSSTDAVHTNGLVSLVLHCVQVAVTPDVAVPFTHSSHAALLVQRGHRPLIVADMATPPVRGTVLNLSQIPNALLVPQSIALGQDVYLRDFNTTQRAMQISCDPRDARILHIDFDRETPRFETLVAA